MSAEQTVWCVWTESGEYEQFSRDLQGIFATEELAEQHANRIRDGYDDTEVVAERVLAELPTQVDCIEYAAHILPSGAEDRNHRARGPQFKTWSHQIEPLDSSRIDRWTRHTPDLYVRVVGSDRDAVETEFKRQRAAARAQLAAGD